jgi:glyoxylase-like metal-dependent hydrolase (beta-lactamase superfamily II)
MNVNVEVLPGVWQVRQDLAPVMPGTYVVIHVLAGDPLLVIDTGLPGLGGEVLELIAALGRRPSDVAAILQTHGHADHIGANVDLRKATGAPLAIHRDDASYLSSGPVKWGDSSIQTEPANFQLADGDVIEFGEHRLDVIHLPGHSPGSVGYYDRNRRILYSGDSLQGRGAVVQHLALYVDPDAYVRSVRRVRELEIEHLIPHHPYLPLTDSIVSGSGVRAFLDFSLSVAESLDPQILVAMRGAAQPLSLEDVTLPLCNNNGFATTTGMARLTVYSHLQRLKRSGAVQSFGEGWRSTWALG